MTLSGYPTIYRQSVGVNSTRDMSVIGFGLLIVRVLFAFVVGMLVHCARALVNWRKQKDISGKNVLVTGGGNGIGKHVALALAKQGCNIVICDIDLEAAQTVATQAVNEFGIRACAYRTDVTNFNEIVKLREAIRRDLGTIDILVNNAGILNSTPFEHLYEDNLMQLLRLNIAASMWVTKIFMPDMEAKRYGHIVAVCSVASLAPLPRGIGYATSKYGIRGFMSSLEMELIHDRKDYIKTTSVYPFFVETRHELVDFLNSFAKPFPILQPDTVANAIVNGIRRNSVKVTVPSLAYYLLMLSEFIPSTVFVKLLKILVGGDMPKREILVFDKKKN